jgi:queuine tRNA-ribosyltransferase
VFEILQKTGKKRLGKITTPHGEIYTPAFGPDATRGLVKNVAPHELNNLSGHDLDLPDNLSRRENDELQFILTNTYHMRSYPGDVFVREMGGIHRFMKWDKPILTDSGGFQVFSLIHNAKDLKGKITDNGAVFRNPINGEKLELTPEIAMDIQFNLGSDLMVVLDEPTEPGEYRKMERSVWRTIEWAKRCKKRYEENLVKYGFAESKTRPLLIGVIQGATEKSLRKLCLDELEKIGFDGYGFGGHPQIEPGKFPYEMAEYLCEIIPEERIRYALGVGTPEDMEQCIEFGFDLFDCVIPSRNARHGLAYTSEGKLNLFNARHKKDTDVLDLNLKSLASDFEKYYLYHLFKIGDALGGELLTIHNLKYYNYIMRKPFLEK